ncbi:MAG: M23 family metallopeptidase [Actinomycetota bacterium]
MPFPTRVPRRHLPTIATAVMVVWLAAVCAYSILAAPASARGSGVHRLVRTALGAKASGGRPQPAIAVAGGPAASSPTKPTGKGKEKPKSERDKKKRHKKRDQKRHKKRKRSKPQVAPGHALPLPARVLSAHELRHKHHDYPALDVAVRPGTKVRAVTAGRVRDTTGRGACGKGVIIRGKDHFLYTYCHGNKRFVAPGKWVDAGDPIMASGNTGRSTGPHLHLQIKRPNGRLVCPQHLLPKWLHGKRVSPWKAGRRGCHR